MATRSEDQDLVAEAADKYGATTENVYGAQSSPSNRIIPAFGWHPWFSYQMFFKSDYGDSSSLTADQKLAHYQAVLTPFPDRPDFISALPEPMSFEDFLSATESRVQRYPLAVLGEVGLDKGFRLPEPARSEDMPERDASLTPGGREGRKLSPYRVSMPHQQRILLAQLALAGRLNRAASVHGVQAHGVLHDTLASTWKGHERLSGRQLKRHMATGSLTDGIPHDDYPFPPRICLHSYSGPAETIKQYTRSSVPCDVYFSFSTTINGWTDDGDGKVESAVRAVPDDRVLIESDLHIAGEDMDEYLRQAAYKICNVKGWSLDHGLDQLARNWRRFVTGRESSAKD